MAEHLDKVGVGKFRKGKENLTALLELDDGFHLSPREDLCIGLVAYGRQGIP